MHTRHIHHPPHGGFGGHRVPAHGAVLGVHHLAFAHGLGVLGAIDAAHAAGVSTGGVTCEDPPGWRENAPGGRLYLAYLRDPAGNKLCVLHRPPKEAKAA